MCLTRTECKDLTRALVPHEQVDWIFGRTDAASVADELLLERAGQHQGKYVCRVVVLWSHATARAVPEPDRRSLAVPARKLEPVGAAGAKPRLHSPGI